MKGARFTETLREGHAAHEPGFSSTQPISMTKGSLIRPNPSTETVNLGLTFQANARKPEILVGCLDSFRTLG